MSKLQEELKEVCVQWYAKGFEAGRAEGLLQSARNNSPDSLLHSNPPELLSSTPVGIAQNRRRGSALEQLHRPATADLVYPPLDFPGFGVGSLAASERVLPLSSEQGELSTAIQHKQPIL